MGITKKSLKEPNFTSNAKDVEQKLSTETNKTKMVDNSKYSCNKQEKMIYARDPRD